MPKVVFVWIFIIKYCKLGSTSIRGYLMNQVHLGVGIILSHFLVLICLVVLTVFSKFTFNEFSNCAAIITPLFLVYTIVIMRWIFDAGAELKIPKVNAVAIYVASLSAFFYVLLMFVGIFWKAYGALGFDNLVKFFGIIEASFASYMGLVTNKLFEGQIAKAGDE